MWTLSSVRGADQITNVHRRCGTGACPFGQGTGGRGCDGLPVRCNNPGLTHVFTYELSLEDI